MSVYDMMNEKKRPVYPAIDEGTYAEDVERGIVEAEKKAAEIEKQAKRDRDMALIGDMAHLVSQGAAMHGGAWKIGQTQNESAKGNERLRALREKNAAQTAAFAKERAALMEAKRKEQNAQKLARYNAELEAYKNAQAQANADRDFAEKERHNKEIEKNDRAREQRLAEQGGAAKKSQAAYDSYQELIAVYPEYKVQEKVARRNEHTGKYVLGEDGKYIYDYTDKESPSVSEVENMLAKAKAEGKWDGSKVIEVPKAKAAQKSPLRKNKNTGSW